MEALKLGMLMQRVLFVTSVHQETFPGLDQLYLTEQDLLLDCMAFENMETCVLPLGKDPPAITSVCFNHNGKILAASATDEMIHMFDMSAGLQITGWIGGGIVNLRHMLKHFHLQYFNVNF